MELVSTTTMLGLKERPLGVQGPMVVSPGPEQSYLPIAMDVSDASKSDVFSITSSGIGDQARPGIQALSQGDVAFLERRYDDALQLYGEALDIFQRTENTLHIAHTWACLGKTHAAEKRWETSILCWEQSEELYRSIRKTTKKQNLSVSTLTSETGSSGAPERDAMVCLDEMIVSTLQKRASVHLQRQEKKYALDAIECHQEVIDFLVDLNESLQDHTTRCSPSSSHLVEGVAFHPISLRKHTELLMLSLETLGCLYRTVTIEPARLECLEDALELLRERQKDDDRVPHAVARILTSMSNIYVGVGELDSAFDSLDEAIDILLSTEEVPYRALDCLDQLGTCFEDGKRYEQAMQCFEKTALVRSQVLGNNSSAVAKSLVNVARVMELQGNVEGSLDLYRAAQSIYASHLKSNSVDVEAEDVEALLELVPGALEQGRYEQAVTYLSKCMNFTENETRGSDLELDKTYLYFSLGRAYIGLSDYVSATVCLLEAAKYDGEISEEQVFALLQHVEFLQRGASSAEYSDAIPDQGSSGEEGSSSDDKEVPAGRVATPMTEELASCSGSKSDRSSRVESSSGSVTDDEGTAYYDSESVSAFDSGHISDQSSSLFHSEGPVRDYDSPLGGEGVPTESELDGSDIDIPENLSNIETEDEGAQSPFTSQISPIPDDEEESDHDLSRASGSFGALIVQQSKSDPPSQPSFGNVIKNAGSSLSRKSSKQAGEPGPSLAKTLTGKFRRQRTSGRQTPSELNYDISKSEQQAFSPTAPLPSEEEYHDIEGPIQFISVRSGSWESNVSQITMRFDDPRMSRNDTQEWWGMTAENFGRWFSTSYVSKAVEVAEGFLSAKSIHSKKKSPPTPLAYISDEESEEGIEIFDHASNVGVADSKTLTGVEFLARIRREARIGGEQSPNSQRYDGALSVYSNRHHIHEKDLDSEIGRCTAIVQSQREKLGDGHRDVASALFALAVLHSQKRSWVPAVECAADALSIQKDHNDLEEAARSLHFLADTYLQQKQYDTASTFYAEALRIEKTHFGAISEEVAKTLNCIGTIYSLQNDFAKAMESHEEALRILKECHGEDLQHPAVADTLCQVGAVYYRERNAVTTNQGRKERDYTTFIEAGMLETIGRAHEDRGRYKMAIAFFDEKLHFLENRKVVDNDDLEEILTTLNSLGMLSSRAGLLVEAIDYYEKALKIQLKIGCDKVQLATARVLTGAVHYQLGDWQKALKLHQDALRVLQAELGEEHQTVAATLFQLGVVRAALFEIDSAANLFSKALSIQVKLFGENHRATLRTRREISNLYSLCKSGADTALDELDEILADQRAIHGDRHPNIAETLHSIGVAYSRRGDYSSALQILEECYYMRTEFLGWDHVLQAATLHEICKIHLKRGRVKKALHICEVVLTIRRESLTEDHIDVALALATKGSCQVLEGKMDSAAKNFESALAIAEAAVGTAHPHVADIHLQIGSMHMRQCQFEAARESIEKALSIYRDAKLADDYPGFEEAKEKLEKVDRDEMLCV